MFSLLGVSSIKSDGFCLHGSCSAALCQMKLDCCFSLLLYYQVQIRLSLGQRGRVESFCLLIPVPVLRFEVWFSLTPTNTNPEWLENTSAGWSKQCVRGCVGMSVLNDFNYHPNRMFCSLRAELLVVPRASVSSMGGPQLWNQLPVWSSRLTPSLLPYETLLLFANCVFSVMLCFLSINSIISHL